MLTAKEAHYYDQQLHPSFAGYLHDGNVSERDVLATIFHLLTKGILEPIWQDGSMLKTLVEIKKTTRQPSLEFDQLFIEHIFDTKNQISTKEIGKMIKAGSLQDLIKQNLKSIEAFPIIFEELKFRLGNAGEARFSLNGEQIDTYDEAKKFKKTLNRILVPILGGTGLLMTGIAAYTYLSGMTPEEVMVQYNIQMDGEADPRLVLLITGIGLLAATLIMYLSFTYSKKAISYNFMNDVIPKAKVKYDDLREFLKAHPLPKHKYINEFLAFSIAFGFDDSWHQDFGLDNEIKVDETVVNNFLSGNH